MTTIYFRNQRVLDVHRMRHLIGRTIKHLLAHLRNWVLLTVVVLAIPISGQTDEYRIFGKVESFSYRIDGSAVTNSVCDFVWSRKNEKWRVDIKEPDGSFPSGVWHTIMPLTENELISIRSYPPVPGNSKSQGNAFVRVLTNSFVTGENIHGSHAIWLALNTGQVFSRIGPGGESSPFWSLDPCLTELSDRTCLVHQTNNSIEFFNRGAYYPRDKVGKLIIEGGHPRMEPYPAPYNNGFKEAELRFAKELLDESRRVSKKVELIYFMPIEDEARKGELRLIQEHKMVVECDKLELGPLDDVVFYPVWTNQFAAVVDFRANLSKSQPLSYVTRERVFNPSVEALEKQKAFAIATRIRSKPQQAILAQRRLLVIVLMVGSAGILGLWILFHRESASNGAS
jgi:hypothetical protein